MKKITLLAGCLLLLVSGSSFASEPDPATRGPRLGVEGGFNLANLNGPSVDDVFGSRLGFVGGGFLNMPLGPGLALQFELLYAQKGGKFGAVAYQLDYVEIPILLDVAILGPIGILLGPAFNANVVGENVANLNQTDVGMVLGVQVSLSKFLISGRYEVGLMDVSSDQAIQNGTFTFMAGLSFI